MGINEATPAVTEGHDPKPPTTTAVRSPEPPPGDHISNLPDTILGEIITLLPTKDGARTQVLASRWRYVWRSAPLNVDVRDLHAYGVQGEALLGVILSSHHGPGRRLCLPAPYLLYQAKAADGSVGSLGSPALDNLQELELYVAPFASRSAQLPSSLSASIFRFTSTLRVLTISQYSLRDYMVETLRFPQLKKLALVEVIISQYALHIILASCPVLESLLLDYTFGTRCLRINSPTIRSIGIRCGTMELVIEHASLLQRLLNLDTYTQMQISVISAPKLETLGCIPELYSDSKIVFGSTVIQGLSIHSLTTVVPNVKILAIRR
ncbi:putative F-box/FBD/LRR-repeat protein At3g49480 [Triticum dicoccoides]|uniref:putative F-box/FBD/LRR-repeat protein At3g49480 n=1 Tax=Triticum dicoccoides TaxID=85692 RepID=UPI00188EA318|nr:putative F-box/FBD/LRR-repeat protein At3g49480 [Triticum dicoccoides]